MGRVITDCFKSIVTTGVLVTHCLNTTNVKSVVPVYTIAKPMLNAHILCGNNKDTMLGMDTNTTRPNAIHTKSTAEFEFEYVKN